MIVKFFATSCNIFIIKPQNRTSRLQRSVNPALSGNGRMKGVNLLFREPQPGEAGNEY